MKSHETIDRIAWAVLEDRPAAETAPPGYAASGRPADFAELARMYDELQNWEHCWSEFLHEFYSFKQASFFDQPSPSSLSEERQAFLAAAAESLCCRFSFRIPTWTQEAKYRLAEPWDPTAFWYPDVPLESRIAASSPIFLKHNILFSERGLIAL